MKTTHLIAAASLLLSVVTSPARNVLSPDGNYAISTESSIRLLDLTDQPILVLAEDTTGATRVEVAWSPDSHKVVVIIDYPRGSAVLAAWTDSMRTMIDKAFSGNLQKVSPWHKTLELDQDAAGFIRLSEQKAGGRLVSENRVGQGWLSSGSYKIRGWMKFSSGRRLSYKYILEFRLNAVPQLDKGGFEEGELIGKGYHNL